MIRNTRAGIATIALIIGVVFVAGCSAAPGAEENEPAQSPAAVDSQSDIEPSADNAQTAVFAGGCFWCMEEAFEKVHGVLDAVSGYAGGTVENPTYYQVVSGTTGHAEVVQVIYDPAIVSYEDLLYVFWRNVDLFDAGGQFCDRGNSYRSGIFYSGREQRLAAEASLNEIVESGRFSLDVATEITELETFYIAEDYHQNYYQTDAIRYSFYKNACGRERRLQQIWGEEAGGNLSAR